MQVLRKVPRQRPDVDGVVVHEAVPLGLDPEFIDERGHVADVAAARGPDVVVEDEDLLRRLQEGSIALVTSLVPFFTLPL